MKKNILLLPIIFFSSFGFSQKNEGKENITRIIIVRHAEKTDDGTKDPVLSEAGKSRAERLNKMLVDFEIDKLFSTPYVRTKATLQPIADSRKLEIINYSPSDRDFASRLLQSEKGKTIVIAGHSNTCPDLVNRLIQDNKYPSLNESDYGKIWMVTFKNETLTDCVLLNY